MPKQLTFAQIKAFAEKIASNGFQGELPATQVLYDGVPYESCDTCSAGKDYRVFHPVGVPHDECI